MAKTIDDLFVYLRIITDILIVTYILMLFKKKHKEQKGMSPILFYCIYNIFFFFIDFYISDRTFRIINYASYTIIEYLTFSYFIQLFIKNTLFKRIIFAASIVFVLTLIIILGFTEFRIIDTIPIGLETILILIYSFYYLYEQMNNVDDQFIYNKFPFWVITGMLIYLAGSFFIYVFAAQVDKETLANYWFLTNAFYFLKNLLIIFGLYILTRKVKNPHPQELHLI